MIEELDQPLRSATDTFPWPHVIRLVQYVRVPRTVQRKISRRALFARDDWRCVYCGTTGGRLTLDHVVPRSRGGESVWENVVTSCAPCNLRKGNRLPHEVSMELRKPPRAARARCSSSAWRRRRSRTAGSRTSPGSRPPSCAPPGVRGLTTRSRSRGRACASRPARARRWTSTAAVMPEPQYATTSPGGISGSGSCQGVLRAPGMCPATGSIGSTSPR